MAITKSRWTYHEIPLGLDWLYKAHLFYVEFDSNIALVDVNDYDNNTPKPIGLIHDPKFTGDFVPLAQSTERIASLHCNNGTHTLEIPSLADSGVVALAVVHGTTDPAVTAIQDRLGGHRFPITRPNHTLAFMLLDTFIRPRQSAEGSFLSVEHLSRCNGGAGPQLKFNRTADLIRDVQSGNRIDMSGFVDPPPFGPRPQPLTCTHAGSQALLKSWKDFENAVKDMYVVSPYTVFHTVGNFAANDAYQGCLNMLDSLWLSGNTTLQVYTDECVDPVNSVAWSLDPCCNITLRRSQCCSRRVVSKMITSLHEANLTAIDAQCTDPLVTQAIIQDYIDYNNNKFDTSLYHFDQALNKITYSVHDCYYKQGRFCQTDSDCLDGAVCDRENTMCIKDDTNPTPFLRCVYDEAQPELLQEVAFKYNLAIDTNDPRGRPFFNDFKDKMIEISTEETCIGPDHTAYRSTYVFGHDSLGNASAPSPQHFNNFSLFLSFNESLFL